jgi:hypothetical protein
MAIAKLMIPARALKTPKIASAKTNVDFLKTGSWPMAAILCCVVLYSMIAPYEYWCIKFCHEKAFRLTNSEQSLIGNPGV